MKLNLLLMSLLLAAGCTKTHLLRIGEKVSNGVCSGWIAEETYGSFRVSPWTCKGTEFNYAWVPKDQVYSIEKGAP